MSYSIEDLTLPAKFNHSLSSMSLDTLAFRQAVDNICSAFKQNHMGDMGRGTPNFLLSSDISLIFAGWLDELKFVRFRDSIAAVRRQHCALPSATSNYIRTTLDILSSELKPIQKLVLIDTLWSSSWGAIGNLKPTRNSGGFAGFRHFEPIKLTIEEINKGVGTAQFTKDHPAIASLFSTYLMISPIIKNKYPELIETADIALARLVECENIADAYETLIDFVDKVEPHKAKDPSASVRITYKLDCSCHIDDIGIAAEIIKYCLNTLYAIEL